MNRREFLGFSALAAMGLPWEAKAWEKSIPVLNPEDDAWVKAPWQGSYRPQEFITVTPSVQPVGDGRVAIWWKTQGPATGWADVSQDGGKTWRRAWTETDGFRDVNRCDHLALVEDYDPTKPLKYRAVSRPIAECSMWGYFRYSGEKLPPKALKGYYIDYKAYEALEKERRTKYAGDEFVEEGEVAAIPAGTLDIAMFNDVHHSIGHYPKLLDKLGASTLSLAVFAGDICDFSRSEPDYDKHLSAPLSYVSRRMKCLTRYVRGNHELMGLYSPFVRNHVALQDGCLYGALTIGDTRLLFLDTGNGKKTGPDSFCDMETYYRRENRWLEKELASPAWTGAKRRIAFAHIPPPCGPYNPGELLMKYVYSPLEKANVTLMMAGHEHVAKFHPAGGKCPYPCIIGGGPLAKADSEESVATVTVASVRSDGLTVRQVDLDGVEVCNVRI